MADDPGFGSEYFSTMDFYINIPASRQHLAVATHQDEFAEL